MINAFSSALLFFSFSMWAHRTPKRYVFFLAAVNCIFSIDTYEFKERCGGCGLDENERACSICYCAFWTFFSSKKRRKINEMAKENENNINNSYKCMWTVSSEQWTVRSAYTMCTIKCYPKYSITKHIYSNACMHSSQSKCMYSSIPRSVNWKRTEKNCSNNNSSSRKKHIQYKLKRFKQQ